MPNNYHDDEASEAEDRIERIRRGGKPQPVDDGAAFDDSFDNERIARTRSRAQRARQTLGGPSRAGRGSASAGTGSGGISPVMLFVGGLLGIVALLIIILLVAGASGGSFNLPTLFQPPATETPIPTETPVPTATEEPSPTPTQEAPRNLGLPPLECLYTGPGCFDFCQDPDNRVDCDGAREFLSRERVDPDTWFNCVAPGPGANVGNPQECLEDAWRAANP